MPTELLEVDSLLEEVLDHVVTDDREDALGSIPKPPREFALGLSKRSPCSSELYLVTSLCGMSYYQSNVVVHHKLRRSLSASRGFDETPVTCR